MTNEPHIPPTPETDDPGITPELFADEAPPEILQQLILNFQNAVLGLEFLHDVWETFPEHIAEATTATQILGILKPQLPELLRLLELAMPPGLSPPTQKDADEPD